jgi:hypothetical protein
MTGRCPTAAQIDALADQIRRETELTRAAAKMLSAHMHARRIVAQILARKARIPARLAELRRSCGIDPR